ncbi:hypothetical protein EGI31_14020, partial [Lacihabitans soyangensis]|nr:hypothetical protein [Lacihabitans soyangensis]
MTINATVANAEAYQFQKRNESTNLWENIAGASGTISSSPAVISHTFFGIRENITTRVVISKNTTELTSNDITISPQRPIFNFQPLDITQCNGLNAIFRISSSGVGSLSHQWQISTGGVFQNISNGSEYSGTTSSSMSVLNLANNENGKVFRCLVKDANNCENYSNAAQLSVNQLSTGVSPTTSTTFCEGQNVQFSVALNVGTVTNYDWQLRKTTESTYTSLQNSSRYENVNTDILKVNGILPNENSYKLNVTYQNLTQNADGSRNTGTCIKFAERTNYTIRPRPAAPVQIDDVYRCSTGKVSASVVSTNKIFWYTDSTAVPFISDNLNFISPTLTATTKCFYSLKDINGCESYKRTFQAIIRPLPSQSFEKAIQICSTENKFPLAFDNINNSPLEIYVLKTTPSLPGFTDIVAAPFSNNFEVSLPNTFNSGDYKFKVFTKNQHCFSDTSLVDMKVKIATKVLNGPTASTVCEGTNHTFGIQYNAENPVSFKWYKNDLLLPTETSASLLLENLQPADQAQYKVEVTGDCGIEMTENALLTVLHKIQITKQPENTLVCQNNTAKFKVEATGTGTLNYEWTRNGEIIGSNSPELVLENVPLAFNNSLIKCKISSDCEPVTFTDEVLLSVDALPIAPAATDNQGFCKNQTPANLMATALPNHSLHWFDENQTELASNQIDVSSIFTKTFYVSQKNSNLCESPKTMIQVSVNEPFEITSISDKTGLCSSGLFNRTGTINTTVSPAGTSGITFELFKDALKIGGNTSGEFDINGGGNYKVIATKGYCSANSEISISSLHPELAGSPSLQAQNEICKNTNITLEASGTFNGGNYAWYSSENSPFQSFLGAEYTLKNVSTNQTWFVAYGITTNDTYCETPRVASSITMLPDLEITAQITNTSCAGLMDGQIVYTITNGVVPYTFSQNGVSNTTGVFGNLSIGTYTVNVVDSKGCLGEKTVTVAMNPGVNITQHPSNINRCRTNIANFTLTASNYDQIVWEKKLPGNTVFEIIAGENLPNLRIENIGNTTNPHKTIYRAKLTKGTCSVYTQEAILFVNSISGTGTSKTVCENASTFFNLSEYTIVGTNKTYQWQYRQGTSGVFTDLTGENAETLSLNNTQSVSGGYYRCR